MTHEEGLVQKLQIVKYFKLQYLSNVLNFKLFTLSLNFKL